MRMSIELTNHCNFKCVYCPHAVYEEPAENTGSGNVFDRPKGFITKELFRKGVEEVCTHAYTFTIGFFGEQQLHPDFDELIMEVPERRLAARQERRGGKFKFILNSNWSLVTEKTVPALRSFDLIRLSIDSSKSDTWESLCPGGSLLDKDGNVGKDRHQTLVDKTKWWLALPDRPPTWLIYVRQDANQEASEEFAREWQPLLRSGDAVWTKSIISYGGVMYDPYMKRNRCKVPNQRRFIVAWDGRCTPCNLDVNIAMAAGDLNTQTVSEIVASPEWAKALQGIRAKQGICSNCFDANNHSQVRYNPITLDNEPDM